MSRIRGRVLAIAGSDCSGGAGIQADIKAVTALRGYAMTAITALTAQNTRGVFNILAVDPAFVAQQIDVVLDDIGADSIKTGMLHNAQVIDVVMDCIEDRAANVPLIADPVMVSQSGATLLDLAAIDTLKRRLLVRAQVLTPNLPEAELIAGMSIDDLDDMKKAAEMMISMGCEAVLLKGGHLPGDSVVDVLATLKGIEVFEEPRLKTSGGHGTGCTLASAIACGIAQGLPLREAVLRARRYVREGLRLAPGLGGGTGPLDHTHTVTG